MAKHFTTKKRYLTDEEKRERAEQYNSFEDTYFPIDVEDFVKQPIFDETIVLKCLACHYEVEIDYEYIQETWYETEDDPYPVSYCNRCSKPEVVPLDVYNVKMKK